MRKTFHQSLLGFLEGNPLITWLAFMTMILAVQAKPADKVDLLVRVYDPSGAVVEGAKVIWESDSKHSRSLQTSLEGKALFSG